MEIQPSVGRLMVCYACIAVVYKYSVHFMRDADICQCVDTPMVKLRVSLSGVAWTAVPIELSPPCDVCPPQ
jgi:hypothetical protein